MRNGYLMKKAVLLAKDIMHRSVVSVPENTDVWELARIFSTQSISGAPVVDGTGCLLGVVSQTDIILYLKKVAEGYDGSDFYTDADEEAPQIGTATARDIMSPHPITASELTPVHELSRLMLTKHIHRIIITEKNKIQGIVTTTDLLKVL